MFCPPIIFRSLNQFLYPTYLISTKAIIIDSNAVHAAKVHVRYPRKQTCAVQLGMSALGQKRTSGAIQSPRRRRSINCTPIGRAPPNRRENLVLHNAGAICLLCGVATAGGTPYASASKGGSWVPRMCLCTDVRH